MSVEIAEVLAEPTWRITNSIALARAEGNWEIGELLQKVSTNNSQLAVRRLQEPGMGGDRGLASIGVWKVTNRLPLSLVEGCSSLLNIAKKYLTLNHVYTDINIVLNLLWIMYKSICEPAQEID